jgi:hypothetical protein
MSESKMDIIRPSSFFQALNRDNKKVKESNLNLFRPPKYDTHSPYYFTEILNDWYSMK